RPIINPHVDVRVKSFLPIGTLPGCSPDIYNCRSRDAAQGDGGMHMGGVAIGDGACRATGEPVQVIIAEGLVVRLHATTNDGYCGRQLQDVTHVVVGAPLAPGGAACLWNRM